MTSLTCILLYSVFLTASRIYAVNLFAGEEVDLGAYNTKVAIGKKVPNNLKKIEIDVKASTNARALVESLRSKFSSGAPPLPPLDPYKSKSFSAISLDGNNGLPLTGNINIREAILTGGKAFRLNRIELSGCKNVKVNLEITIPELNGNVLFDAQLHLATIFPVDVNGEIRASLKGVKINVIVWAREKKTTTRNIYSLQGLQANFHTDDLKIQLVKSNLSEFIINMAGTYLPLGPNTGLRTTVQNLVKNYTANEVFKQVNNILGTLTVHQIKALLKVN